MNGQVQTERYNGWSNWETWLASQHLAAVLESMRRAGYSAKRAEKSLRSTVAAMVRTVECVAEESIQEFPPLLKYLLTRDVERINFEELSAAVEVVGKEG